MVDRREISLGGYATLDEAIRAREEAEIKYFGDFKYKCDETLQSNSAV